jgi:hypothetical protein
VCWFERGYVFVEPLGRQSLTAGIWQSSMSWDNNIDIVYVSSAGLASMAGFYPGFSNRTVDPRD